MLVRTNRAGSVKRGTSWERMWKSAQTSLKRWGYRCHSLVVTSGRPAQRAAGMSPADERLQPTVSRHLKMLAKGKACDLRATTDRLATHCLTDRSAAERWEKFGVRQTANDLDTWNVGHLLLAEQRGTQQQGFHFHALFALIGVDSFCRISATWRPSGTYLLRLSLCGCVLFSACWGRISVAGGMLACVMLRWRLPHLWQFMDGKKLKNFNEPDAAEEKQILFFFAVGPVRVS